MKDPEFVMKLKVSEWRRIIEALSKTDDDELAEIAADLEDQLNA